MYSIRRMSDNQLTVGTDAGVGRMSDNQLTVGTDAGDDRGSATTRTTRRTAID